jgi:hypothetical protein
LPGAPDRLEAPEEAGDSPRLLLELLVVRLGSELCRRKYGGGSSSPSTNTSKKVFRSLPSRIGFGIQLAIAILFLTIGDRLASAAS